jgi:hypothetical protein
MEGEVSRDMGGAMGGCTDLSQARLTGAVELFEAMMRQQAIGRGFRPRVGRKAVAERVQWCY